MSEAGPELAALAAARTLAVDVVVAEVVPALRAAGVPSILLKGASLVGWLYAPDEGRVYGDADLLVAPDRRQAAEDVLKAMGFELQPPRPPATRHSRHARPWRRSRDGATVDLHRMVPGVRCAPEEAWRILCEDRDRIDVRGADVDALGVPGRTLLVALHLAHHRSDPASGMVHKPATDLRLALDRLPESTWRQAAELATRLHCRERLSSGLHEDERGAALAVRLGLPGADWMVTGASASTTAAFERLRGTRGRGARVRLAARMAVPTPATMRWQYRLARRGPAGLALAYALRPFRLLVQAVPGFLEWRRLR